MPASVGRCRRRPSTAARAELRGGGVPVQQRDHRDDEVQPDRGARGRRRDLRLRGHDTSTLATAAVEKPSGIVGAVGRWTIRVIGLPFRVAPGHEPTARSASRMRSATSLGCESITRCEESISTVVAPTRC